jgi:hypothetical protein
MPWDPETFARIAEAIVADEAPRVFAIFEEYGERVDGRIAAWGMSFADHADIVGVDGGSRMRLRSPERALAGFGGENITPRVVWVNPVAATRLDGEPVADVD